MTDMRAANLAARAAVLMSTSSDEDTLQVDQEEVVSPRKRLKTKKELDKMRRQSGNEEKEVGTDTDAELPTTHKSKLKADDDEYLSYEEESLGVIQEMRRKREIRKAEQDCQNLDDYVEQAQQELQNGRENVINQYIQKIDDVNTKIEDAKQILNRNEEMKEKEMKRLKEKQDLETEMLDGKFIGEQMDLEKKKTEVEKKNAELEKKKAELELRKNELGQEMDDIEESMIQTRKRKMRDSEVMNKRHKEENIAVEENCKTEGIQQVLEKLHKTRNQLSSDLNKQEMDPNDSKKLEEAREMLECPICLVIMVPPTRIWMCSDSHSICEDCRDKLPGNVCPTCRSKKVILRALRDEKFASALFN